ncbi:hypothetical protein J3459_010386 [Metarhizium acridum]|nr:hypothetical protein J3459_010386 [Metarhizium acridum]
MVVSPSPAVVRSIWIRIKQSKGGIRGALPLGQHTELSSSPSFTGGFLSCSHDAMVKMGLVAKVNDTQYCVAPFSYQLARLLLSLSEDALSEHRFGVELTRRLCRAYAFPHGASSAVSGA